jgi:hypothetical protein
MSCCGDKFLALASASRRNPNIPPSASQEEKEGRLLENYLGDDFYKIQRMSKDDLDEALLYAMAWDLSKKVGRHKHAYERRKSPPGFWDIEFPNTQEMGERKEQVKQYESELVKERYMEAVRKNGRYLFRDA